MRTVKSLSIIITIIIIIIIIMVTYPEWLFIYLTNFTIYMELLINNL